MDYSPSLAWLSFLHLFIRSHFALFGLVLKNSPWKISAKGTLHDVGSLLFYLRNSIVLSRVTAIGLLGYAYLFRRIFKLSNQSFAGLLEDRLEGLAGSAPRCPEINDDDRIVSDYVVDIVLCQFLNRHGLPLSVARVDTRLSVHN